MPPLSMPPTTKSFANSTVIYGTTPFAVPGVPTLAELNAGEFLHCHTYEEFVPTVTQNIGEGKRKSCAENAPQEFGQKVYTLPTIEYSYVPQDAGTPGAAGNEAKETLTEDAIIWIAWGPGLDGKTSALVAGDVVNLYDPVQCGVQDRGLTDPGEFGQHSIKQGFILIDGATPKYDYVVPAV